MSTSAPAIPLPPVDLMQRVGKIDDPDVGAGYEEIGRHSRARIERLLPDDWLWEGKRVLDFGCGAGRTLRQFRAEAENAEFHGCDIDSKSVDWLETHMAPTFHVFRNAEAPPLPRPDGCFGLVYALSVFTHLAESSAAWLLEVHRVLKPGGLLIATFLNEGHWGDFGSGDWDENRIGMNVVTRWNPWDTGGPIVFHSEWWIREHWGRAFDVLSVERFDPVHGEGPGPNGQGAAVLRARPNPPAAEELSRPADDPREVKALGHNVEQLHREASELFDRLSRTEESRLALADQRERLLDEVGRLRLELEPARAQLANANEAINQIARSKSWRLTAPLRAAATSLARRRNR